MSAESIKGISLHMSEDGKRLIADYQAVSDKALLNKELVKQNIQGSEFADLFIFENAIDALITHYKNCITDGSVILGEKRDALVSVHLSSDRMEAHLDYTPAFGGNNATREQVEALLKKNNVVFGIKQNLVDQVLANSKEIQSVVIAQGKPVQHGDDTRFDLLIEIAHDRKPKVDENGMVDYHDLGDIPLVERGQRLMRRVPPTTGEDGTDVSGKPITAKAGRDMPFARGLKGVAVLTDDANLLVAAQKGLPVVVNNGVNVETVIIYDNINLATGNVDFDGSVLVKGDISAGMKVKATGDIIVKGLVEAAELEAGGDISITQGVVGKGEKREDNEEPKAVLKAGGGIAAQYVENAHMMAEHDIIIKDLLVNAQANSYCHIVVGVGSDYKGQILGGHTKALLSVVAKNAGSTAGTTTDIEAGIQNDTLSNGFQQKVSEVRAKIKNKKVEQKRLLDGNNKLKQENNPANEEMLNKILKALNHVAAELDILNKEEEALSQHLQSAYSARIEIKERIYSGVRLHIGSASRRINDEVIGGLFRLQNNTVLRIK